MESPPTRRAFAAGNRRMGQRDLTAVERRLPKSFARLPLDDGNREPRRQQRERTREPDRPGTDDNDVEAQITPPRRLAGQGRESSCGALLAAHSPAEREPEHERIDPDRTERRARELRVAVDIHPARVEAEHTVLADVDVDAELRRDTEGRIE